MCTVTVLNITYNYVIIQFKRTCQINYLTPSIRKQVIINAHNMECQDPPLLLRQVPCPKLRTDQQTDLVRFTIILETILSDSTTNQLMTSSLSALTSFLFINHLNI